MSRAIITLLLAFSLRLVRAAGEEDVFELQPEIHHVFREAEKMPPAIFSKFFTLITLAPWLVFIGGVSINSTHFIYKKKRGITC